MWRCPESTDYWFDRIVTDEKHIVQMEKPDIKYVKVRKQDKTFAENKISIKC